ncbi:MAG TPA: hypothetical protein VEL76_03095 [Gemmataceae bacterium]|nr:hypothetical protein [Gemmataceae bacterium]
MKHHEMLAALAHEFELSFLATGLTPVARQFGDGNTSGCLVTALDVSEHGNTVPTTFADTLNHDVKRVERVREYLRTKFPGADAPWWATFVGYLILGYDRMATCPRQWMQRTCNEECHLADVSPKLLGAAVGGLLRYRLLLVKPVQERTASPVRRPRKALQKKRRTAAIAV